MKGSLNDIEISFGIYDSGALNAKAIIKNGKCVKIQLLFKSPSGFYYSFLNDAEKAFEDQYPQYL